MSDEPPPDPEEEFLNEVDPYGDRFGTSIPLWGCLIGLAVFAIIVAVIWHAVATSTDL